MSGGTTAFPLFEKLANGWNMVNPDWAPYNVPMMVGIMGPWQANTSVANEWCRAQLARVKASQGLNMDWGAMNYGLEPFKEWFKTRTYTNGSVAPDGTRLFVMPGFAVSAKFNSQVNNCTPTALASATVCATPSK